MDKTVPLRKDNPGNDSFDSRDHTAGEHPMVPVESSLGKRIHHLVHEFSIKKSFGRGFGPISSLELVPQDGIYISPDNRQYEVWWYFMVLACVLSSMFTPIEFGFFRGLPRVLWIIDLSVQSVFIADIIIKFFLGFKDPDTYRLIGDNRQIATRYLKSDFVIEALSVLPWDTIYKGLGHHEEIRYLVWIRLYRVVMVNTFFDGLEKDIRFNYFAVRIVKLLAVLIYCTHTAACLYYYLATTVAVHREGYTWIGSLTLGNFAYADFRAIDLGKRYVTALYWAVMTMTTVGYGDIHAVNAREMIFCMIFVTFNMIIGAYLLGNMTALIVKGSATERFRDKMSSLIEYMDRHQLPHNIRKQMKSHVLLQFETGKLTSDDILESLPGTVRSQVAHSLYSHILQRVPIFRGCSTEFLDELVSRVDEEHFLPGEIVVHQGGASDQFFIVCQGVLEEVLVHEDGKVEVIEQHQEASIFGEVGVLCNIPQPFTVRVVELCKLLRLHKHSFNDLVQIYFNDGRLVINNLLEWKDTDARIGQIAADVTFLVAKQAAELALMVNNASYQGDLTQLKHLVKQGAIVARADYDGRTALHLAASKGFEGVVLFLIREGADVNAVDKFGITPLLEAVKGGHDHCMSVLADQGAQLNLHDSGSVLCSAVKEGNNELLRRLLLVGADPSATDYDKRTALHLAAAEGNAQMARMLIDGGADIYSEDRWGRTPLDEATTHDHGALIPILKEADTKRKQVVKESPGRPSRLLRGGSDSKIGEEELGSSRRGQSSSGRNVAVGRTMDFENAANTFRAMPIRQKGRPPAAPEHAPILPKRRRMTIFPFHPWIPSDERTAGRLDWVPASLQDIQDMGYQHFGKQGTKLLNHDGGVIPSTDLIVDGEKIYIVDDNDLKKS